MTGTSLVFIGGRRNLSLIKQEVGNVFSEERLPLKQFNKISNRYENITVKKVTAEKTLKAAISLLFKASEVKPATTNLNAKLIEAIINLLPEICAMEKFDDLVSLVKRTKAENAYDKDLDELLPLAKMLFQLKSHKDYYTQIAYSCLSGKQGFYPKSFVKFLQALFLMDLPNNNLINDINIENSFGQDFKAWCKNKGLNQDLLINRYYSNNINLKRENKDRSEWINVRLNIGPFIYGVEFNILIPPASTNVDKVADYGLSGANFVGKKITTDKIPRCDSYFRDEEGDVVINTTKGDPLQILHTLTLVGAITPRLYSTEATKEWQNLKGICIEFYRINELSLFSTINPTLLKEHKTKRKELLKCFINSLTNLKLFINPKFKIIFMDGLFHGNYLNGALTLELISFLKEQGLKYSIILSEHDFAFAHTFYSEKDSELPFSGVNANYVAHIFAIDEQGRKICNLRQKVRKCYLEHIQSSLLSQNGNTLFASSIPITNIDLLNYFRYFPTCSSPDLGTTSSTNVSEYANKYWVRGTTKVVVCGKISPSSEFNQSNYIFLTSSAEIISEGSTLSVKVFYVSKKNKKDDLIIMEELDEVEDLHSTIMDGYSGISLQPRGKSTIKVPKTFVSSKKLITKVVGWNEILFGGVIQRYQLHLKLILGKEDLSSEIYSNAKQRLLEVQESVEKFSKENVNVQDIYGVLADYQSLVSVLLSEINDTMEQAILQGLFKEIKEIQFLNWCDELIKITNSYIEKTNSYIEKSLPQKSKRREENVTNSALSIPSQVTRIQRLSSQLIGNVRNQLYGLAVISGNLLIEDLKKVMKEVGDQEHVVSLFEDLQQYIDL